ncbi:hypothetical protein ACU21_01585 [Actinobaculum suis]|nr:hypothetical protein ACU21_01585 [Actinobaculum suis]
MLGVMKKYILLGFVAVIGLVCFAVAVLSGERGQPKEVSPSLGVQASPSSQVTSGPVSGEYKPDNLPPGWEGNSPPPWERGKQWPDVSGKAPVREGAGLVLSGKVDEIGASLATWWNRDYAAMSYEEAAAPIKKSCLVDKHSRVDKAKLDELCDWAVAGVIGTREEYERAANDKVVTRLELENMEPVSSRSAVRELGGYMEEFAPRDPMAPDKGFAFYLLSGRLLESRDGQETRSPFYVGVILGLESDDPNWRPGQIDLFNENPQFHGELVAVIPGGFTQRK